MRLRSERAELWADVLSEKRGELAAEFDATHSVERAVRMGSVRSIIQPATLRPYLIDAVERGIERALDGHIPSGHDGARLAYELGRLRCPPGDAWLSARERAVLGRPAAAEAARRLAAGPLDGQGGRRGVARRRCRAGRGPGGADGAPDAWLDGAPAPVSLSLSHRAGRALAAVTDVPAAIGCDLELVEPRSGPFVREWLTRGRAGRARAARRRGP